jgi:hypothetical protein
MGAKMAAALTKGFRGIDIPLRFLLFQVFVLALTTLIIVL